MTAAIGNGPVTIVARAHDELVIRSSIPFYDTEYPGFQRLWHKQEEREPGGSSRLEAALDKLFESGPSVRYIDVHSDHMAVCYSGHQLDRERIEQLAHEALD
jgi:hypothetical protein